MLILLVLNICQIDEKNLIVLGVLEQLEEISNGQLIMIKKKKNT